MAFYRTKSSKLETGFGLFDENGLKALIDINGTPVEYVGLSDFTLAAHHGCFHITADINGEQL